MIHLRNMSIPTRYRTERQPRAFAITGGNIANPILTPEHNRFFAATAALPVQGFIHPLIFSISALKRKPVIRRTELS